MDPGSRGGHDDGRALLPPSSGRWAPPDAGASGGGVRRGATPEVRVEIEDPPGPPPPPAVRRRRRRRRVLAVAAALVVVGVPVGLAVVAFQGGDEAPPSAAGDADDDARTEDGDGPDAEGGPDSGQAPGGADEETIGPRQRDADDDLDAPDPSELEGLDADYAELLRDIDASEQVMIAFQERVTETFASPDRSPDGLRERLREIGTEQSEALQSAREELSVMLADEGAEVVRIRYLAHLDSWVEYMDAVSEDPAVLSGEGAGAGYSVVINATADVFARALEEELPADVDESVRDYAVAILERGFRGIGEAQV